ncbi:TlpA family protein disulfide reductase [Paenibacillus piscarius]|uniref:TlpA family protein disulfide reductase n=1 Tax=Paenibacillus piscarius TaxID=1089681 RepID=UPI001EE8C672|nr:TlpA disulfide reductase family protein [Paenibacillus piscarius]
MKILKTYKIATWLVIVAASVAIVFVYLNHSNKGPSARVMAGAPAPEFEATALTGDRLNLADYRGKVVLLNFWASWCKPCMQEMPLLNEIHLLSGAEIETLFINVGESKGTVSEYMKERQFSFPVVIDVTGKISALYRVTALPSTFIINKDGGYYLGHFKTGLPEKARDSEARTGSCCLM